MPVAILTSLTFLTLSGCKRDPAPVFGDPTGVQLVEDGTKVQIAVATSGGPGVTASVNTVASGFDAALKTCPDAVALLKKAQGFRTQFSVVDGKTVAPDPLPNEPAVACVLKAINGKSLFATSPGKYAVLAEFRQLP